MSLRFETNVEVYLNGKRIGTIKPAYDDFNNTYYQYFPKGSSQGGEKFYNLETCKKSLL